MRQPHQHAVSSAGTEPSVPAAPARLVPIDGNGRSASRVFDIPVELAQPAEMLRTITQWAGSGRPHRVMYVNAHVVNESRALPELRQALDSADLVYCDGYGVRLAARALDVPVPHRMTGADWVWGLAALCEAAGHSIYLLGSEPGYAAEAAERLRACLPAPAHGRYAPALRERRGSPRWRSSTVAAPSESAPSNSAPIAWMERSGRPLRGSAVEQRRFRVDAVVWPEPFGHSLRTRSRWRSDPSVTPASTSGR